MALGAAEKEVAGWCVCHPFPIERLGLYSPDKLRMSPREEHFPRLDDKSAPYQRWSLKRSHSVAATVHLQRCPCWDLAKYQFPGQLKCIHTLTVMTFGKIPMKSMLSLGSLPFAWCLTGSGSIRVPSIRKLRGDDGWGPRPWMLSKDLSEGQNVVPVQKP